ncbi:hypothetical protein FTUN_3945 [Frigoriglobus tundricola]|uniref:Uncharacterized protein n=1 Tax=Frigoriglobus tundricola TaxID=2774151 RepID=A0A6M5YR10_9BACT|nr:hypothetical protein FTUN_3945 [Frigoriglobus tundricola]
MSLCRCRPSGIIAGASLHLRVTGRTEVQDRDAHPGAARAGTRHQTQRVPAHGVMSWPFRDRPAGLLRRPV